MIGSKAHQEHVLSFQHHLVYVSHMGLYHAMIKLWLPIDVIYTFVVVGVFFWGGACMLSSTFPIWKIPIHPFQTQLKYFVFLWSLF